MCKVKKTISLSQHILDKAEIDRKRLGLDLSGYISVLIATGNVNNGTPQYPFLPMELREPPLLPMEDEEDEEELERKKSKIDFMLDMDEEEEEE